LATFDSGICSEEIVTGTDVKEKRIKSRTRKLRR
jgi:hypothetical protein